MQKWKEPDLRLTSLEAFVILAEERSLPCAGRRLSITQGTVKRRVDALQGWLDKALFADTSTFTLTTEGLRFIPVAKDILVTLEGARTTLRPEATTLQRRIAMKANRSSVVRQPEVGSDTGYSGDVKTTVNRK
jgi:DNA-binding transcriptional LysR family regulator